MKLDDQDLSIYWETQKDDAPKIFRKTRVNS